MCLGRCGSKCGRHRGGNQAGPGGPGPSSLTLEKLQSCDLQLSSTYFKYAIESGPQHARLQPQTCTSNIGLLLWSASVKSLLVLLSQRHHTSRIVPAAPIHTSLSLSCANSGTMKPSPLSRAVQLAVVGFLVLSSSPTPAHAAGFQYHLQPADRSLLPGASQTCLDTFNANVSCHSTIGKVANNFFAVLRPNELLALCNATCVNSLRQYRDSIQADCDPGTRITWPATYRADQAIFAK